MMSQPIPQAKMKTWDAELQATFALQPVLTQIAEQLAQIESKLNALSARSNQMEMYAPPAAAAFNALTWPRPAALSTSAEPTAGKGKRLRLYCFGRFEAYDGDQPIQLQRAGKGSLILKFLSIARQPILRDVLLETMWPESDPQVANNRLKVAIHHLRKSFARSLADGEGMEIISFRDGVYSLNPDLDIWTDVREFETLCQSARHLERAGRLEQAAELYLRAEVLYRGDLYEQDIFEDWTLVPREALKDIYLTLLDQLAAYYVRANEMERAIEKWKKIIAHDAGREDAYRRLMQCYAERGQRALAMRWYDACAQALREQLGVEPDAETQALYQRLRKQTKVGDGRQAFSQTK